ncbi:uncharacterized protein CLUP02_07011 [Colletotrichum lupini]|uniref:Uncharacterized protein n=1 Tax=Colletotrichum lupini TaxID=145971 RepID=A0A9Q8SQG5_9PEZI|nr:uncharacterized protein CLUP02_07011 [Colletotrichum lupini]UQC81525.1 hypothetical protein CLUP02_07011 [Colletotrichum lupini]
MKRKAGILKSLIEILSKPDEKCLPSLHLSKRMRQVHKQIPSVAMFSPSVSDILDSLDTHTVYFCFKNGHDKMLQDCIYRQLPWDPRQVLDTQRHGVGELEKPSLQLFSMKLAKVIECDNGVGYSDFFSRKPHQMHLWVLHTLENTMFAVYQPATRPILASHIQATPHSHLMVEPSGQKQYRIPMGNASLVAHFDRVWWNDLCMPPTPVGANINAGLSGELPQTRVPSRSKYGKCFSPHDNINTAASGNQSRDFTVEPSPNSLGKKFGNRRESSIDLLLDLIDRASSGSRYELLVRAAYSQTSQDKHPSPTLPTYHPQGFFRNTFSDMMVAQGLLARRRQKKP